MSVFFKCNSFFILFILVLSSNLKAQEKVYHIIDSTTKRPIAKVSVLFTSNNQGSLTNDDGDVKLFIDNPKDTLNFSFLGYNDYKLSGKYLFNKDTIKLVPNEIILQEVNVYSLDLKAKIAKTINKYWDFYSPKPTNYYGTFKESVFLNDTLSRLNQIQFNWYNQIFRFKSNEDFIKENQISVQNIDFSKSFKNDSIAINFIHSDNVDFFKYQFPNFNNFILDATNDVNIDSIIDYKNEQKIVFTGVFFQNGIPRFNISKGVFYFEKGTNALIKISLEFDYLENKFDGIYKPNGKKYSTSIKKQLIDVAFKKRKNKWYLNYCSVEFNGKALYNDKTSNFDVLQTFLVNSISNGKKIQKKNRVDLTDPLYKNTPTFKGLETKILLTKQEQAFLDKD